MWHSEPVIRIEDSYIDKDGIRVITKCSFEEISICAGPPSDNPNDHIVFQKETGEWNSFSSSSEPMS